MTAGAPAWVVSGEHVRSALTATPSGFKHLLVPVLALAAGSEAISRIDNVPDILETRALAAVAQTLGIAVHHDRVTQALILDGGDRRRAPALLGEATSAPEALAIHGAMYLIPVLVGVAGSATLHGHGGCAIGGGPGGRRPIEHIAAVIERFGGRCDVVDGGLRATARRGLHGTALDLAEFAVVDPVTGTLTGPHYSGTSKAAILAAAVATGRSRLRNLYPKPDVSQLLEVLAAAGLVTDLGDEVVISGTGGPLPAIATTLPSDLLEVVSNLCLAVHLRKPIAMELVGADVVRAGLHHELVALDAMGVDVRWSGCRIDATPPERPRSVRIQASSHRCYSDSQPLLATCLIDADGTSVLGDSVWSGRFDYAAQLAKVGAVIDVRGSEAVIEGQTTLHATDEPLVAGDLRAAMALVIAAAGRRQPQHVQGVEHLERGYADLAGTLTRMGIDVREVGP